MGWVRSIIQAVAGALREVTDQVLKERGLTVQEDKSGRLNFGPPSSKSMESFRKIVSEQKRLVKGQQKK
jgi:hypothetical protein